MTYITTATKTPTYFAAIGRLSDRVLRDFEDWAWLQNVPTGEETLNEWLEKQPATIRACAQGR